MIAPVMPMMTAAQRFAPTRSPSIGPDRATMNRGAVKAMVVASARRQAPTGVDLEKSIRSSFEATRPGRSRQRREAKTRLDFFIGL